MLTRGPKTEAGRRGRPKQYGIEVVAALKRVWETGDRMCSRRLQPFLPELVQVLERHGELTLADEVKEQLCPMSVATIDRVLKPYRKRGLRRPFSTTKPGSLLKASIPIRTFADWDDKRPGFLELDLVAHCGQSTEGFYLNTLSTVDVATGWVEVRGVWGKGQQRVGGAIHQVYDAAKTPYRRLLGSGVLAQEQQDALKARYQGLNPVRLLSQINQALERLWRMAATTSSHQPSVTFPVEATKAVG